MPDPSLTIRQGAIAPWAAAGYQRFLRALLDASAAAGIPADVPFRDLSAEQVERVLNGVAGRPFTGVRAFFRGLERRAPGAECARLPEAVATLSHLPGLPGRAIAARGTRRQARGTRYRRNLQAHDSRRVQTGRRLEKGPHATTGAAPLVSRLERRLAYLEEIGVDYLTLDRAAATLSAGELRRVGLTKTLGSGLVNTLYVLDEPTLGLHAQDVGKLIAIVERLRDQRNTVVVVEHDDDFIRAVDHIVDLGPGAGAAGGQVLYSGPVSGLIKVEGSPTADFLSGRKRAATPRSRRPQTGRRARLSGASGNNLKAVDVTFPLGLLCVVTGVSGAGKSTLVEETLYPALRSRIAADGDVAAPFGDLMVDDDNIADVVFLDQGPLGRSARSNPATHLGVFDEIRKTFAATHEAKLRDYDAGRFSFNVDGGRCNACQGRGFITIDMQFLPDVLIRCPECLGTRYRPEVLEITYRGKNIAEVLDLTAREAFGFFRNRPKVQLRLRPLLDIGLDYLRLGQPVSTLSGGEAQRLKLAGFLARSTNALKRPGAAPHIVFLLDEPTAGLHPMDIARLLETLNALIDRGHSVIVIEHNMALIAAADWIIDMGPGAGENGGRVVALGTPEDVAQTQTPTGRVLARGSLATWRRESARGTASASPAS